MAHRYGRCPPGERLLSLAPRGRLEDLDTGGSVSEPQSNERGLDYQFLWFAIAKTFVSNTSSAIFCANIQSPAANISTLPARSTPADPVAGGIELVDVHHLIVPDSVPRLASDPMTSKC